MCSTLAASSTSSAAITTTSPSRLPDAERMDEARQELHKLMEQEELKDAVLLVYANKQDVAGALSVQQVAESLQLGDLPDSRVWYLQACAAASADGAGVTDGLDWLAGELAKRK